MERIHARCSDDRTQWPRLHHPAQEKKRAACKKTFSLFRKLPRFGVPEEIRTPDPTLRSMAYRMMHGSRVTSDYLSYIERLVVNEICVAKCSKRCLLTHRLECPISKFLASSHLKMPWNSWAFAHFGQNYDEDNWRSP